MFEIFPLLVMTRNNKATCKEVIPKTCHLVHEGNFQTIENKITWSQNVFSCLETLICFSK